MATLRDEIDRILWELWDPIGLNDSLAARDEYSSYVGGLERRLRQGASVRDLERHLQEIERSSLGLSFPSGKATLAAEAIRLLAIK